MSKGAKKDNPTLEAIEGIERLVRNGSQDEEVIYVLFAPCPGSKGRRGGTEITIGLGASSAKVVYSTRHGRGYRHLADGSQQLISRSLGAACGRLSKAVRRWNHDRPMIFSKVMPPPDRRPDYVSCWAAYHMTRTGGSQFEGVLGLV